MFTKNFTASLLLTLLFSNHTCLCMHVESYWESWVLKDYPDDWCALLKEVPASPVGSKEGSNYICIGMYCSEFDITYLKVNTTNFLYKNTKKIKFIAFTCLKMGLGYQQTIHLKYISLFGIQQ